MDDAALAELYYRTTLELADSEGTVWKITPTDTAPDNPDTVLSPYTDAFILTAENPESSGLNTPEDNQKATASLQSELDTLGVVYRDCPGYGFDVDHVEQGFALLADQTNRDQIRKIALNLATRYRQNAIFHLHAGGLSIIGALRAHMTGIRNVEIRGHHPAQSG
jgi:hypothetical protein